MKISFLRWTHHTAINWQSERDRHIVVTGWKSPTLVTLTPLVPRQMVTNAIFRFRSHFARSMCIHIVHVSPSSPSCSFSSSSPSSYCFTLSLHFLFTRIHKYNSSSWNAAAAVWTREERVKKKTIASAGAGPAAGEEQTLQWLNCFSPSLVSVCLCVYVYVCLCMYVCLSRFFHTRLCVWTGDWQEGEEEFTHPLTFLTFLFSSLLYYDVW